MDIGCSGVHRNPGVEIYRQARENCPKWILINVTATISGERVQWTPKMVIYVATKPTDVENKINTC